MGHGGLDDGLCITGHGLWVMAHINELVWLMVERLSLGYMGHEGLVLVTNRMYT